MIVLVAIFAYAVLGVCIAALRTRYSKENWPEDDAPIVAFIWPFYLAYLPLKWLYNTLVG